MKIDGVTEEMANEWFNILVDDQLIDQDGNLLMDVVEAGSKGILYALPPQSVPDNPDVNYVIQWNYQTRIPWALHQFIATYKDEHLDFFLTHL